MGAFALYYVYLFKICKFNSFLTKQASVQNFLIESLGPTNCCLAIQHGKYYFVMLSMILSLGVNYNHLYSRAYALALSIFCDLSSPWVIELLYLLSNLCHINGHVSCYLDTHGLSIARDRFRWLFIVHKTASKNFTTKIFRSLLLCLS